MIALFLISLACRQPHPRRLPAAWEILSGLLIRTGIVDQTLTIESAGVVFRPYENGGGRVFAQTFGANMTLRPLRVLIRLLEALNRIK